MKTYLLTAAGVIFFSVIVSLLIPEGKLHKTIIFIMRIVCILVLIQPVTGIFKINTQTSEKPAYDYAFINKVYSENQSMQLEKLLQEEFSEECSCVVQVIHEEGKFKVDSVNVQLNNENFELVNEIYEYLENLGYINITVYAKSN